MAEPPETFSLHPKSRGYALIITNRVFRLHQADRDIRLAANPQKNIADLTRYGAEVDDENLQYVFDMKLKFQLLENRTFMDVNKYPYKLHDRPFWIHYKPPANKIHCKCLSCKIQTTDHSRSECFVLAISTHGAQVDGEQEICFSDDYHVDRLKLADIVETLKDENCRTLAGKPRIIILNMCRSDPDVPTKKQDKVCYDDGFVTGESKTESITTQLQDMAVQEGAGDRPTQESESDYGKADYKEVEEEYYYGTEEALRNLPPNFLIVFPCVRGKKTFHHRKNGSWLIDELRKVVEQHDFSRSPEMNFLSVLTKTAGRVAVDKESEKGKKTAVCIVHRLLEPIIFKEVPKKDESKRDLGKDKPAALYDR